MIRCFIVHVANISDRGCVSYVSFSLVSCIVVLLDQCGEWPEPLSSRIVLTGPRGPSYGVPWIRLRSHQARFERFYCLHEPRPNQCLAFRERKGLSCRASKTYCWNLRCRRLRVDPFRITPMRFNNTHAPELQSRDGNVMRVPGH
jgi:hypothetical protein